MRSIVKLIYRPVFRWAVRRALVGRSRAPDQAEDGRFTRSDADRLLARTWQLYDQLAPAVPKEEKVGPRMNVHLAALTVAFHRALVEIGIDARYATALTTDCAWAIYEKWGRLARRVARSRTSDPAEQMRICIDDFLRFPFTPPCYRFQRSQPQPGTVEIDMRRCPVADYMATQDASELCVSAWCNQDFALAELWGGELRRTKTLAGGDEHCDFRFVADSPAHRESSAEGSLSP
jgi:hypothetical protein